MASIYIETFGCQMNEADSRYIAERAEASGYEIATDPTAASVVVLNTCTVRDNAERRAYGRMAHFKALKAADPNLKLVVCGCLAEQDRAVMRKTAPHLDAVFGTSELPRLAEALAAWRPDFDGADGAEAVEARALLKPLGGAPDCVTGPFTHLRAFVTVQRGCSYYCTFCIVPHVRGRFDHRPVGEIVAEARGAIAAGARELTLVGQTVNAYKDPTSGADFSDLLETVAALPNLERLTFVTSHPKDFTEKLAKTLGSVPQLNPRLHLPVQSGSSKILRRMNRKYTAEQYKEKAAMLRTHAPNWYLSTDIIVGFPTETESDFEQTLTLCQETQFSQAFMFIYSKRKGTPAALWDQVDPAVSSHRFQRLAEVINTGMLTLHKSKEGQTVRALIEGPSRKNPAMLAARSTDNVTLITPRNALSNEDLVNTPWLDIKIEEAHVWGCTGTLAGRAESYSSKAIPITPLVDLLAAR
jgi:tRNA-2-methylthio-N6-dimethylallyladenosine synthase